MERKLPSRNFESIIPHMSPKQRMQNKIQEALEMEKMGQEDPEVAGEATERTDHGQTKGPRIVRLGKPRD